MSDGAALALDADHVAELLSHDACAAADEVRRAARAGDIEAQALFAQMLIEGKGIERDPAEALHWYSLAANSGHALAMNMLGRCHELGTGTPIDFERAAAWYRKAAKKGLDWGMYNYAHLLATGRGVKPDRAQAFAWYRRAADLGHAKSMNFVGRYYEEGWETEADAAVAFDWYRRSAEGGDFRGQASYAAALTSVGRIDEAVRWLELALASGTPVFLQRLAEQLDGSPHAEIRDIATRARSRLTPLLPG